MIENRFNEVFSFENLYKAHLKARLSKRDKKSIVKYEMELISNLYDLYKKIQNGTYNIGVYSKFIVYEPKKRQIQTLNYYDRIVQHVLCDNLLMPYFTKRAVLDNCVCQVGKGTHFAHDRLKANLHKLIKKNSNDIWCLKCDIKKYFPSLPHKNLVETFCKHIRDVNLKNMVAQIIDSFHTSEVFLKKHNIAPLGLTKTERGIPIGNQTSQVFGMFYLNSLDRLVKEKLRIKVYSRYMDDFLLFSESKEKLTYAFKHIKEHIKNIGLQLNSKTQMFPLKNGFNYLGFNYSVTKTGKILKTITTKTRRRMKWRVRYLKKLYEAKLINSERVERSLVAFHGHLCHAKCWYLENKLRNGLKPMLPKEVFERAIKSKKKKTKAVMLK